MPALKAGPTTNNLSRAAILQVERQPSFEAEWRRLPHSFENHGGTPPFGHRARNANTDIPV
jgi:hypothetical protein